MPLRTDRGKRSGRHDHRRGNGNLSGRGGRIARSRTGRYRRDRRIARAAKGVACGIKGPIPLGARGGRTGYKLDRVALRASCLASYGFSADAELSPARLTRKLDRSAWRAGSHFGTNGGISEDELSESGRGLQEGQTAAQLEGLGGNGLPMALLIPLAPPRACGVPEACGVTFVDRIDLAWEAAERDCGEPCAAC